MRFRKAAFVAAVLAIALSSLPANAGGYGYVVARTVMTKSAIAGGSGSGGGSNWYLCPTPAGIFICAIAVGIVVHEVLGPSCASRTKYNIAHGYDTPTFWRPLCNWKRDPKPIAVRG